MDAADRDKVVVDIIRTKKSSPLEGKIVEILGSRDSVGIDIKSIVRQFGIRDKFPDEVTAQAKAIVYKDESEERLDLRGRNIFTIDGEDAKDFDDAVSIARLDGDTYELGVHIADVSHYVLPDTPIDLEARARGTSVYLLDRVIPMLPFELSNDLCSLKPHVDRLAVSVFMQIDSKGAVISRSFHKSVIRSVERMTYTNVTKILNGDANLIERYKHIYDDLKLMEELMAILSEKRKRRGALDFDNEEAQIILDQTGKPVEIKRREREVSHRLIEEFMIVCNETVAEHLFWAGQSNIYRIHESPSEERMRILNNLLSLFGYRIKGSFHPRALQNILDKVKGKDEEILINRIMLRSMKKAVYSPDNLKHFGLASDCYCHFTSPIRRYPDLIVHRQLKSFMETGIATEADLREIAEHSSFCERIADDAEYAVDDMKKAEYMQERIGEEFDGLVSGITSYGFFVELPNTIEGLVRLSDLPDRYDINEKLFTLVGRRSNATIRIGNPVRVKVKKADKQSRTVDFELVKLLKR